MTDDMKDCMIFPNTLFIKMKARILLFGAVSVII